MDRNPFDIAELTAHLPSLSARRAWIEIIIPHTPLWQIPVALRKESVDRNKYVVQCRKVMSGRSPQGERG